jgi:hypothetical protein
MNNLSVEGLRQWNVNFPLKPGDLPDDTYMTQQALQRQTVHLGGDEILGGRIVGGRIVIREMDLKNTLKHGRGTMPAMGPG